MIFWRGQRAFLPTNIVYHNRTGATGYIGGDFLHTVSQRHPEYAITVLVRREETISRIKESYPGIEIVEGDLDDGEKLAAAAADVDVVLSEYQSTKPSVKTKLSKVNACRSRSYESPSRLQGSA